CAALCQPAWQRHGGRIRRHHGSSYQPELHYRTEPTGGVSVASASGPRALNMGGFCSMLRDAIIPPLQPPFGVIRTVSLTFSRGRAERGNCCRTKMLSRAVLRGVCASLQGNCSREDSNLHGLPHTVLS